MAEPVVDSFRRRDKTTGGLIYINYTGVVEITPEVGAVLGGKPEAKSTEFGGSCKLFPSCKEHKLLRSPTFQTRVF